VFYGTRKFITAFTTDHQLLLSSAISIQSTLLHPTWWRRILILYSHLRLDLPSGLFQFSPLKLCMQLDIITRKNLVRNTLYLTFQSLAVTICTTSLNTKKFYILTTEYLYLLYVSQEKKPNEVFPIQPLTTGFYNRGGKCLLRGTTWVFK
jgi:hypothetical protein